MTGLAHMGKGRAVTSLQVHLWPVHQPPVFTENLQECLWHTHHICYEARAAITHLNCCSIFISLVQRFGSDWKGNPVCALLGSGGFLVQTPVRKNHGGFSGNQGRCSNSFKTQNMVLNPQMGTWSPVINWWLIQRWTLPSPIWPPAFPRVR